MRRRPAICLLLALLGLSAPAAAQSPLSLPDAIARARAHNPDAGSSAAGEREAAQRVTQARAGYWPRVEVAESWQRGNQPVFVFSSLLSQRQFTAADFALGALNHPDAVDNELLINHLKKLNAGEPVELPIYDFRTHTRLPATTRVDPKPIVIVEGILIFAEPRLLEQMDIKVFVDTPDDIRFIRRLGRDIAERGRTLDSVIEQYMATVRPMHMQFVEPSRRFADVIIPEGGHNLVSIDLISGKIRERLARDLDPVGGQN